MNVLRATALETVPVRTMSIVTHVFVTMVILEKIAHKVIWNERNDRLLS